MKVLDDRIKIEAFELLGVVKILAHRVGSERVCMEHADIEMLRPPVAVGASTAAAGERALAGALVVSLCVHGFRVLEFPSLPNLARGSVAPATLELFQTSYRSL